MLRTPLRACAIAALLLVALADSRGQTASPAEAARGNASIDTQQNERLAAQQNERIILLLEQLAEQARQSDDVNFAVRTQSQAATLLCPYDPVRARAIYRRAFQSLTLQPATRANETAGGDKARPNLTTAERLQLRTELLNQIAARDPELADELARTFAESSGPKDGCAAMPGGCDPIAAVQSQAQPAGASTREDIERREVLMSVALRIVEREPEQAMALAQMSFTPGLSPNFSRLLMLMRTAEPGLADLLFSSAVARLERASAVDLADIHTLGSYLVSAGSSAREAMGRALVTRFLNLAFNQIARRDNLTATTGAARAAKRDESAAIYFIGRQLTDLFARYQPDRLEQLQYKISELTETGPPDPVIDMAAYEASGPAEMEADALDIQDAHERDSLYARAALAWLAKDELRRAQSAAFAIHDAEMRDRVLGQIARKHSTEGRIEDAVAVARRIDDGSLRVEALVMLAGSALALKNRPRAIEILNEAENNSAKLRIAAARVNSLLKVASAVSAFDTPRGFEIMQSVVKAINEAAAQQEELKPPGSSKATASPAPDAQKSKIAASYSLVLESTLAILARADFERALLVAQQIEIKEASVAAQLAVCRGGLAPKPSPTISTTADDIEASADSGADK